ncbi:hypothetical protein C8R48DRAFT_716957 [Suillus tomentosus]|nr:hypothetical protein C8R48DRAFT_716957 [Suillus tomentosus]
MEMKAAEWFAKVACIFICCCYGSVGYINRFSLFRHCRALFTCTHDARLHKEQQTRSEKLHL